MNRACWRGLVALALVAAACGEKAKDSPDAGNPAAEEVRQTVSPTGGALTHPTGAGLLVPSGALAEPVELSVLPAAPPSASDLGSTPVGEAFVLGPEGQLFLHPIDVVVPYDPARLPAGFDPAKLRVMIAPNGSNEWSALPTTVDAAAHRLTAQTTHFSVVTAAAPQTADPLVIVSSAALPYALRGAGCAFSLVAKGGTAPYTWTALTALPAGLTLSAAGVLQGTPTGLGAHAFTLRVTDGAGQRAEQGFSLTITETGNPAPAITGVTPASVVRGAGATHFGVAGTGFIASSKARWDDLDQTTTPTNSSWLAFSLPAEAFQAAGLHRVTVTNPGPGGGVSNSWNVEVVNPKPVLSSITPAITPASAGSLSIDLTGLGFVPESKARAGLQELTTVFKSATLLQAVVPPSMLAAPGTVEIRVFNPLPGGGTSDAARSLTVTDPAAPVTPRLLALSPQAVRAGAASPTVTLVGESFVSGTRVFLNYDDQPTAATVADAHTLTFVLPAERYAAGSVMIRVGSPSGTGWLYSSESLFVLPIDWDPAVPQLTSALPAFARRNGKITVLLTGSGFESFSTVELDGLPLSPSNTNFVTSTELYVTLEGPQLAELGSRTLRVRTLPGQVSAPLTIEVVDEPAPFKPVVTSISPDSTPVTTVWNAPVTVTVLGSNFLPAAQVVLSDGEDEHLCNISSGTATELNVTCINSTFFFNTGRVVALRVRNPDGLGGAGFVESEAVSFTIGEPQGPITISALSPQIVRLGTTMATITVTVSGIVTTATLEVDGVLLENQTCYAGSSCLLQPPASALAVEGPHTLRLLAGIHPSNEVTFTVQGPALTPPVLATISPTEVDQGASLVTLSATGSGFAAGALVRFGLPAVLATVTDASHLSATIPTEAVATESPVPVTVWLPDGFGGYLASNELTLAVRPAPPYVDSVDPPSTVERDSEYSVLVHGSALGGNLKVLLDDVEVPSIQVYPASSTLAQFTFPVELVSQPRVLNLKLRKYGAFGGYRDGNAFTFEVKAAAPVVAPAIERVEPARLPQFSAAATVQIFGANFTAGSTVTLAGVEVAPTAAAPGMLEIEVSQTLLETAGTLPITVRNPDPATPGAYLEDTVDLPVVAWPRILAMDPDHGAPTAAGIVSVISGVNFGSDSAVRTGATLLASSYDPASGALTVTLPGSVLVADAALPIVVENTVAPGDVRTSAPFTFQVDAAPTLTVAQVVPPSAPQGATTSLVVSGTGFTSTCRVYLGAKLLSTYPDGTGKLLATIYPFDGVGEGTHLLTVQDSATAQTSQNSLEFQVTPAGNPVPYAASYLVDDAGTDKTIAPGSTDRVVLLTGANFVSGTTVKASGTPVYAVYLNTTSLQVRLPASLLATAGTLELAVANPGPAGGAGNTLTIPVENPLPALSSLSPTAVAAGSADAIVDLVTARRMQVLPTTEVRVGGEAMEIVERTEWGVKARIPASELAAATTLSVALYNPEPGGGSSEPVTLSVLEPGPGVTAAPVLTSVSPDTLTPNLDQVLTITGENFTENTIVVRQGATSGLMPAVLSPTQLQQSIWAWEIGTAGTYTISLYTPSTPTAPGGGFSQPLTFTVGDASATNPAPSITSLTPATLPAEAPSLVPVTVTGTGFVNLTRFEATLGARTYPLEGVNCSATGTSCQVPFPAWMLAGPATGTLKAITAAPGGGEATTPLTIAYPVPAVTAVNPTSLNVAGAAAPLQRLIFNASATQNNGLVSATYVYETTTARRIDGVVENNQRIVVLVPADLVASAATLSFKVMNGPGIESAAFSVPVNALPSITGLSPDPVTAATAFTLTISGTNLNQPKAAEVMIGDTKSGVVLSKDITVGEDWTVLVPAYAIPSVPATGSVPVQIRFAGETWSAPASLRVN